MMHSDEKGTTMVEFGISLLMFLVMIGGVFDIGMMVKKRTQLDNGLREISRTAAIRSSMSGDCKVAPAYIDNQGRAIMSKDFGIAQTNWRGEWNSYNDSIKPTLRLTASSGAGCYFLCSMFPAGFEITVAAEVTADNSELGACEDFTV